MLLSYAIAPSDIVRYLGPETDSISPLDTVEVISVSFTASPEGPFKVHETCLVRFPDGRVVGNLDIRLFACVLPWSEVDFEAFSA